MMRSLIWMNGGLNIMVEFDNCLMLIFMFMCLICYLVLKLIICGLLCGYCWFVIGEYIFYGWFKELIVCWWLWYSDCD